MIKITIKDVLDLCCAALATLHIVRRGYPKADMGVSGIEYYDGDPEAASPSMRFAGTVFKRNLNLHLMEGFTLQKRLLVRCPEYRWSNIEYVRNAGGLVHGCWNFLVDWDRYTLIGTDGVPLGDIKAVTEALYEALEDLEHLGLDLRRGLPDADAAFNLETGRLVYAPDVDDYVMFDAPGCCEMGYVLPGSRCALAEATINHKTVTVARSNISGNVLVACCVEDRSLDESTQLFISGSDMAYAIKDAVKTAVPGKERQFLEKLAKQGFNSDAQSYDMITGDKELAALLTKAYEAGSYDEELEGLPPGESTESLKPPEPVVARGLFDRIRGICGQLSWFYGMIRRAEEFGKPFVEVERFKWFISSLELLAEFFLTPPGETCSTHVRMQHLELTVKEAVSFVGGSVDRFLRVNSLACESELRCLQNDADAVYSALRMYREGLDDD